MNHFSILAVLGFSIITTITWALRKVYLNKQDLISFILLETLFVSTAIIAGCYYHLGYKKFIEVPFSITPPEFIYMTVLGILIAGSIFALRYLIKYEDVSRLSPMIGGTKTIMVVIMGILLFGEEISIKKLISIGLIISGLFMLLNHTH